MQAQLRYAAFDLDGTVLDDDGNLFEGVEEGIAALRGYALVPIVVTGRSYGSFRSLNLPEDFLALWDDGFLLSDGNVLLERATRTISCRTALSSEVLRSLLAHGCSDLVAEYAGEPIALSRRAALQFALAYRLPRSNLQIDMTPRLSAPLTRVTVFSDHDLTRRALGDLPYVLSRIQPYGASVVRPEGTCKALALAAYLKHRFGETSLDRVVAFGDGENDTSLLASAALGVAVQGSCHDAISQCALHLTEPLGVFLGHFDPRTIESLPDGSRTKRAGCIPGCGSFDPIGVDSLNS